MKFNHLGIPTAEKFEGEIDIPHLKMTVSDHANNPYGIQWMRFWPDAPYPELVQTVPHAAFEVDDLMAELKGKKVIIEPNAPSEGLLVAFIEVNNAPVELMEYNKETSSTKPEQLNRSKQTDPQAS
ncbi:VOC family protein [Desulfogranum mediterraneum]|uniref:VOC family protein n=1 Tax=Desulfogranum mediterraneum TaxID=160661 RepID=UPI000401F4B1|nr:glyoxalase/bleomycin resistance/dioxygenase family protein [Desulfogranum mediterraneum]